MAQDFARRGAHVTYVTRAQWYGEVPRLDGVVIKAVSANRPLYGPNGVRRLRPTLEFGWGVAAHFLRHRKDYDAVFIASFPFFSLIGVRLALAGTRMPVVVSWVECWTGAFWRTYAGPINGRIGALLQRLCIALTPVAIADSTFVAHRLVASGLRSVPRSIPGLLPGGLMVADETTAPRHVLFAGRHIADKGVDLLPAIVSEVHDRYPELLFVITGDGPLTPWLRDAMRIAGLDHVVTFTGFVPAERLASLTTQAYCVLLPSRREGFGILAGSAAAYGAPVVVGAFPENAAVDLIEPGVNGMIVDPPCPEGFAEAISRILEAGATLRGSAKDWFRVTGSQKTMRAANALVASTLAEAIANAQRHGTAPARP